MNTLFRMAFYITLLLIVFNLGYSLITSIEGTAFSSVDDPNVIEGTTDTTIFNELTGLSGAGASIWAILTGVGAVGSLAFSWMVQSIQPVALYVFGVGFWTSYNGTITSLGLNEWLPPALILMITVAMIFLFVGATIGLITGNG
jgi:hypothetical protein